MPFGLKNAGATYQRAMTAIFHDMIHDIMEDYVDDIVIKSKKKEDHLDHLRRVFQRCRKYQLKMNPLKCAFGVSSGKFLGCKVHKEGISIDEGKVKSLLDMKEPTSRNELRTLVGKLSYIRRFVPALAELISPFQPLLKKGTTFAWGKKEKEAWDKIKRVLASTHMMSPPIPGQPMILYLTSTEHSVGALLAQEVEGMEKPVYYLSRLIKGAEMKYSPMEKHCLSLIYATQKFRHYFLAHVVHLVTKSDPIRFLVSRPVLSGRLTRWALIIGEFKIVVMLPRPIKSQALADLLALFPSDNYEPIEDSLPGELPEVVACEEAKPWTLYFDGSPSQPEGGAGVVITSPEGKSFPLSYKLGFGCTNNEAEYEALVLGLSIARSMGIKDILVKGDSNLVVKQVTGQFGVKEPSLASYRERVLTLAQTFRNFKFRHVPRAENKQADALATFGAKVQLEEASAKRFIVTKKVQPCSVMEMTCYEMDDDDWRHPIIDKLKAPKSSDLATLKEFYWHDQQLFKRGTDGLLMRCVARKEGMDKAKELHINTCGEEGAGIHRRMQRVGCYWPTMKEDCDFLQAECQGCHASHEPSEANFVSIQGDWRRPYIEYIRDGTLPLDLKEASRVKKKAGRYFIEKDELFRRSFKGQPMRCVPEGDKQTVMEEVHQGACGEHQGARKLYEELLRLGYYWPTMEADALSFARRCLPCQKLANSIHAPAVELHALSTPWPFHSWAFDLIGPISPNSRGKMWILAATELFSKWVEAVALKKANAESVATFIKENIICRFGLPRRIISDNGTPFVNKTISNMLARFNIIHDKSSPYYPKGNGQAEATNKSLLRIMSRMVQDAPHDWSEYLPLALWAYRTSKRGPTQATPFSLVYGADAMLPVEIVVPSARMALEDNISHNRETDLEAIEERRDKAQQAHQVYQRRMVQAYDRLVRPRMFQEGDLVLRAAEHVMRGVHSTKFAPKWEGPFRIKKVYSSGYSILENPRSGLETAPVNFKFIKKFYG